MPVASAPPSPLTRATPDPVPALPNAVGRTVDFVLATADPDRTDRLWPADARVYDTNPLNLVYGAAGIALFLDEVTGLDPASIFDDHLPFSDVFSREPNIFSLFCFVFN